MLQKIYYFGCLFQYFIEILIPLAFPKDHCFDVFLYSNRPCFLHFKNIIIQILKRLCNLFCCLYNFFNHSFHNIKKFYLYNDCGLISSCFFTGLAGFLTTSTSNDSICSLISFLSSKISDEFKPSTCTSTPYSRFYY